MATLVTPSGTRGGRELDAAVRAAAEVLRRHGVGAGDRVLLAGGNSPELVIALLALMHLDATVVLFDEQQPPDAYRREIPWDGLPPPWSDPGRAPGVLPAVSVVAAPG